MAGTKPGSRIPVQVWRKGAARDLVVAIGEMPDEGQSTRKESRKGIKPERAFNRLGLLVSDLTADQKRELRVPSGLVVDDVRGPAARSELRPGDLLLAIIDRGVTTELRSVEQFNRLLAQVEKNANVTLLVRRGDIQSFVTLKANGTGKE